MPATNPNSPGSQPTPDRPTWSSQALSRCLPTSEWMLSMAVLPVLTGFVGIRMLATATAELGELAEEIFRGDRLPLLNIPQPQSNETSMVEQ
ncbi:MAG: hypothetical protein VKL01_07390 [Limnothrix sp.]|nr:hypothetical protein [Limnothrix sp.]